MIDQKFRVVFQISRPANIPQKRTFGCQVSNETDPKHGGWRLLISGEIGQNP